MHLGIRITHSEERVIEFPDNGFGIKMVGKILEISLSRIGSLDSENHVADTPFAQRRYTQEDFLRLLTNMQSAITSFIDHREAHEGDPVYPWLQNIDFDDSSAVISPERSSYTIHLVLVR